MSFSKVRSVYKQRTGIDFEDSDYASWGIIDEHGELTNAGAHFVELKNTGKLLVQEVRQHFGALSGNLAAGWKGLCVEF